jgi:outer membrane protein
MSEMKEIIISIFLSALSSALLIAQENNDFWSLERCITFAHENNLQVKRQSLNVDLAEKDLKQSFFEVLPNLNGGIEHQFSSGRSLNLETYKWENTKKQQGSMGLSSNLTVFNGLQNFNSMQYRKYSFLSAKEDLEKVKNDITLSLLTAYLQVLFNKEILNVARKQYEVTLMQVNKISRLVEVGNLAKGELLEIKAQAATEKLNIATAQNVLNISILDLTQILDLDSVGNFHIIEPDNLQVETMGLPEQVGIIYNVAIATLPEIKSSEYNVKMSEKYLSLQRGQRSPNLTLGGLYYSRYLKGAYNPLNPGLEYFYREQLKDNQYSQLSLGLDIPIFNRLRTQTNISKAKIQLMDSHYSLEQKQQSLYKNIQQVYGNALATLEKYYAASEAVTFIEEAFKYSQQKFEVGLISSVDYNIAKNNLLKANSDLLQSKYEYIFRMKIIDFYKGKPIEL